MPGGAYGQQSLHSYVAVITPATLLDERDQTLAAALGLDPQTTLIQRALAESDGVVARAARSLGISRQSFYKAMQRSGIY
jgi:transcriptional regulator of acetoin/glycerol metabolism